MIILKIFYNSISTPQSDKEHSEPFSVHARKSAAIYTARIVFLGMFVRLDFPGKDQGQMLDPVTMARANC
jgi:hypothetical protein